MELMLKKLRQDSNLNQKDYGKLFNLTQGTYCNYENGITQPDLNLLVEIANYHNVSLDFLVGRTFADSIGYLTEKQRSALEIVKMLNERNLEKAVSYMSGILAVQD